MRRVQRRLRSKRRGISPVIATILLLAITIILVATLYYFIKVPLSPPPPVVQLSDVYNATNVVVYGEGNNPGSSNCPGASATCTTAGSIFVVAQVQGTVDVALVTVQFVCEGAVVMSGSLTSIESPQTTAIGAHNLNTLCPAQVGLPGPSCIGYPASSGGQLGDMVYFLPLSATIGGMQSGSELVVYSSICSHQIGTAGSFYYGAPQECSIVNSGCSIQLIYTGQPTALLATIPITS